MGQEQFGIPSEVDIESLPNVKCECGSELWDQATKLKKLSAIVSRDGQEKLIALPVVVCRECGKKLEVNGGVIK